MGGGVEVHPVDNALEQRVLVGDGPEGHRQSLADLVGKFADDAPNRLVGIGRLEREIEANKPLVMLDQLEGLGPRADFFCDAIQLVVEDVAEPLREDKRQDVILVLRRILGAADRAGRIPDPGFEGFIEIGHLFGASFGSDCVAPRPRIAISSQEIIPLLVAGSRSQFAGMKDGLL